MTKKEDNILGKLNIKNYNNELEEILENKKFPSDTKNFLLSMLYKIEIAYNDYFIVKKVVKPKKEFISEILEIIKDKCDEITLIKPLDTRFEEFKNKKEKCEIDIENKSITCIYSEKCLLYALFKLKESSEIKSTNLIEKNVQQLVKYGKCINSEEVLRDFDGWSWNINETEIENSEYNLVFQSLLFLIGEDFNTIRELRERLVRIDDNLSKKMYIIMAKIALMIYINENHDKIDEYKQYKALLKKDLKTLENKEEYFDSVYRKVERLSRKIRLIDKCFNDTDYFKKEYLSAIKNVANSEKISVKEFIKKLELEKKKSKIELQQNNLKLLPQIYEKEVNRLKEEIAILSVLTSKKEIYDYIIEFLKLFFYGMQNKIKKTQARNEIMQYIYILRYYGVLKYNGTEIKNIKEIKDLFQTVNNLSYSMAYKMNALNLISINETVNNDVLRQILDTKIIDLKNIEILITAENYQIVLKIFDEDNIEKIMEFDTITGLVAKHNRKFRLFIK